MDGVGEMQRDCVGGGSLAQLCGYCVIYGRVSFTHTEIKDESTSDMAR